MNKGYKRICNYCNKSFKSYRYNRKYCSSSCQNKKNYPKKKKSNYYNRLRRQSL
ncbi:unnamed protein product, partial [marine sediment metagenome]